MQNNRFEECDYCEKVDPFEVEIDYSIVTDKGGDVQVIFHDPCELAYFLSKTRRKLRDKFGENKISITQKVTSKDDKEVYLCFKKLTLLLTYWRDKFVSLSKPV